MRKADFNKHRKTTIWRHKRRLDLLNMLGGKCQVCGYNKCPSALSFHHRDPSTKLFNIGVIKSYYKMDTLIEEVKKCDLLCRNCHVEYHSAGITRTTYGTKLKLKYKTKIVQDVGGKCIKCNYSKCLECLPFHHRDPSTKTMLLSKVSSFEKMKLEAEKCDLLCQNCHVETHYKLLNTPTPEFIEEYLKSANTNSGFKNICRNCGLTFELGKTKSNFICRKCFYSERYSNLPLVEIREFIDRLGYNKVSKKYGMSSYILKQIIKLNQ